MSKLSNSLLTPIDPAMFCIRRHRAPRVPSRPAGRVPERGVAPRQRRRSSSLSSWRAVAGGRRSGGHRRFRREGLVARLMHAQLSPCPHVPGGSASASHTDLDKRWSLIGILRVPSSILEMRGMLIDVRRDRARFAKTLSGGLTSVERLKMPPAHQTHLDNVPVQRGVGSAAARCAVPADPCGVAFVGTCPSLIDTNDDIRPTAVA